MANRLNDWTQEKTDTVGTGDLNLTGVLSLNQARFRDGFGSETVYYSVLDGANREAGIGTFNGVDKIVRSYVHSTLVNGTFNDVNPTQISLTGDAVVSGTFNTYAYNEFVDNIAGNTSRIGVNETLIANANGDVSALDARVTVNETDIATNTANITTNTTNIGQLQTDLTVLDTDVSYRESAITALEFGGVITQNGNTAIQITAGSGEIIDSYNDTENQITEDISWVDQGLDLLSGSGMPVITGLGYTLIGVESTGNGDGTSIIKAYPNGLSSGQRKIVIVLGIVEYQNQVITKVQYEPVVSNQLGNTLMDLIEYVDTLTHGLVLRPTNTGDLSLWRDSGDVFRVGSNYANAKDDQNVKQVAAVGAEDTGVTFDLISYNNGTTGLGATVSLVPNATFEPDGAGSIDAVGNGKTVIHYYMEAITGRRFVLYGQQEYADHATAVTNLFADKASHLFPLELEQAFLLGQIVVDKGALVWGITAEIFPTDSATSSGSSSGSASQAVSISYNDTYNLGNNLQSSTDSLAALKLTPNQIAAVRAANVPTDLNPFVVESDLTGVALPQNQVDALNAANSPSGSNAFAVMSDITTSGLPQNQTDALNAANAPSGTNEFVVATDIANMATDADVAAVTLTQNQYDALDGSNSPSSANVFVTELDIAPRATISGSTSKNLIDNGDFSVWQRGDAFAPGYYESIPGYSADRWYILAANPTAQVDRVLNSTNDGKGDSLLLTQGGGLTIHARQGIEWTNQFAPGSKWTVQYEARSIDGGIMQERIGITDSIGDLVSLIPLVRDNSFTLTTEFVKYSFTFEIPAGVPLTAEMLVLNFNDNQPTSGTSIEIRAVQLEAGEVSTPLEVIHPADQLARCHRYCFPIDKGASVIAYSSYSNDTDAWATILLNSPLRASASPVFEGDPTFEVYLPGGAGIAGTLGLIGDGNSTLKMKVVVSGGLSGNSLLMININGVAALHISADYK